VKPRTRNHVEDLRGLSRLAVQATRAVTDLVEAMHQTIGGGPSILGRPFAAPVRLLTAPVYGQIRAIANVVGAALDGALAQLEPMLGHGPSGAERDGLLAALNGVLGDYLVETQNPLAIEPQLVHRGHALDLDQLAIPGATRKLLVLVHGSSMNERQWQRRGHDHGAALAAELGYTAVYLHYNSGRHISTSGRDLAGLLERLARAWPTPIDEVALIGHSMGGLVARSACHHAELAAHAWRTKLGRLITLGTPHHGAPLERGGSWIDLLLGVSRYSAPLARLGQIRSAGVTDLRHGNVLDEHWEGRDRFAMSRDLRTPLPLPTGVACYAIAGTTATGPAAKLAADGAVAAAADEAAAVAADIHDAVTPARSAGGVTRGWGRLPGDGLVPVASALGRHERPALTLRFRDCAIVCGTGHLDLLSHAEVYAAMRAWLAPPAG
jgi:pimeloyl-ACP methyl ester carboxylesterase